MSVQPSASSDERPRSGRHKGGARNGVVTPEPGRPVRLRGEDIATDRPLVMGIINRTHDSFFPGARQLDDDVARESVEEAIAAGADIIDVGGIKAAPGADISPKEEIDRVIPFVKWVRESYPEVYVSVDTYRGTVALAACEAGADIINDTWGGADPGVMEVAGRYKVGVVCSHTGGVKVRSRPHRMGYGNSADDVVSDVVTYVSKAATRAVSLGVPPGAVFVDPTHDFGKNTWHGLTLLRHTERLVALGYPVMMALSRKDFVGETLDLPVEERLSGTLGATAVAVWLGAKVVRAHDVRETRQVVDMVASIRGERVPSRVVRGLA